MSTTHNAAAAAVRGIVGAVAALEAINAALAAAGSAPTPGRSSATSEDAATGDAVSKSGCGWATTSASVGENHHDGAVSTPDRG